MPPSSPQAFGNAITQIRRSLGLTQKAVAERISTYYSDDRAYRRIERGERQPERDAVIAIAHKGLEIADPAEINFLLEMAGYAALTSLESQKLQPPSLAAQMPPPRSVSPLESIAFIARPSRIVAGVLLGGSFGLSVLIAPLSGHAWFAMTSAIIYASLYAVSLLLESALDARIESRKELSCGLFSVMLASSTAALVLDSRLARSGSAMAVPVSFAIFAASAVIQWAAARAGLSETAVVPMQFQSHTAQAAHLKNTLHFMAIVVFFWLPPFHCISVFEREIRMGHAAWVAAASKQRLIIGRGIVAFGPEVLWWALPAIIILAIGMAFRLLENLKSHPAINSYTSLLYLRASLYFLLILVCLVWYSVEIGSMQP